MMIWYGDGTKIDISAHPRDFLIHYQATSSDVAETTICHWQFELDGNTVRQLEQCSKPPKATEDCFKDISDVTKELPLVNIYTGQFLLSKRNYHCEIETLLRCQN